MNHTIYPENTVTAVKVDSLIRPTDKRLVSDRMSSRMIKCASVLDEGEYLGWQMVVPARGLVRMSLFGTGSLCRGDLEWIMEKTGKTSGKKISEETDPSLRELYEVYLPAAAGEGNNGSSMGFAGTNIAKNTDDFSGWPAWYSSQFDELVRVLRITGAAFRVTAGPASEEEKAACRKHAVRTYHVDRIPFEEYMGRPVKMSVLLRLPSSPSVRLKTVIEESVRGAKLRHLGNMEDAKASSIWDSPLVNADVLPDCAARILMMEPELHETAIGIMTCEKEVRKIPASHKNPKDRNAVVIGSATDTSGTKRRITIGEMDLRRHYQIIGQTGTGKSTLLATLILSAIERGHGLTFFDPHGSTIDTVLRSIPEKYADKVRVVRIGDTENPVPLNIWDSDDPAKEERNISDLCELFADIFDPHQEGFVGPRYERWLSTFAKASIAFLGHRASLESIAVISQSQSNMLKVSKAIVGEYPELVETIRQEYGTDKSNDFQATLNWYLCKFQRLTSVVQLRKTLGAGANALDFRHTIDTDTVTLIDLASPTIGTSAARIIGTLLLMKLWNAALGRKERDRTHLIVIDEAALFQTNPMPRMLAEARKFGVSLVLSHQHTGQLSREIRDALESNSANFSAFRLSPRDAETAAVRFNDPEMQVSLARLDAFNAVTSLSVDGRQTPPFTLETLRPREQANGEDIARQIERRSIERLVKPYEAMRALTTAEIQELLDHPEKLSDHVPEWLQEWTRRRNALLQKAV